MTVTQMLNFIQQTLEQNRGCKFHIVPQVPIEDWLTAVLNWH